MLEKSASSAVAGIALFLGLTTACESTKPPPAVTHDGLHRVAGAKMQNAYLKPGEDFSQYTRVRLVDCYVAFKKNWRMSHSRVTTRDMEDIKQSLGDHGAGAVVPRHPVSVVAGGAARSGGGAAL